MGTLQEAMQKAGVASDRQVHETQAEMEIRAEMEAAKNARPWKEKEKRFGILRETLSPDTFRREARKLLLLDHSLVQEILNIAHAQGMHRKKDKGGGRLIRDLYLVKEATQSTGLSNEAKQSLVDKLFPKK